MHQGFSTWDEQAKACVSHHFLRVCMHVRLISWMPDYAEPEQQISQGKARQIWTTPTKKALRFFISAPSADRQRGKWSRLARHGHVYRRTNYESQISANQILVDSLCST